MPTQKTPQPPAPQNTSPQLPSFLPNREICEGQRPKPQGSFPPSTPKIEAASVSSISILLVPVTRLPRNPSQAGDKASTVLSSG